MKLEPVALSAHMTDAQIYAGLFECDALERVGYSEEMLQAVRRLIDSAIPEGYVAVPVDELLAALAALIRPDDPLESLGGSARDRAFNFGVETAINRCKDLIASKDGAANVAAYTPKTVVNGYLLEACPKCGCFGSESPCAVCKLRAASPKEQS